MTEQINFKMWPVVAKHELNPPTLKVFFEVVGCVAKEKL